MSVVYTKADLDVLVLMGELLAKHHPGLHELGVKVGVYFADGGDDSDAVVVNGYPATGMIRNMNLLNRVAKDYDAELVLDKKVYDSGTEEHKAAILDHYLSYLELVPNTEAAIEEGEPLFKSDDLGRPKLRLRKGDWNAGPGFSSVVKRHGKFAAEFLHLDKCYAQATSSLT